MYLGFLIPVIIPPALYLLHYHPHPQAAIKGQILPQSAIQLSQNRHILLVNFIIIKIFELQYIEILKLKISSATQEISTHEEEIKKQN